VAGDLKSGKCPRGGLFPPVGGLGASADPLLGDFPVAADATPEVADHETRGGSFRAVHGEPVALARRAGEPLDQYDHAASWVAWSG
jgi:hypothetical protein